MTAFPLPPHRRPLTIAEYTGLGEDDAYRWAELQEGALVMSPSPTPDYMLAVGELAINSSRSSHPTFASSRKSISTCGSHPRISPARPGYPT